MSRTVSLSVDIDNDMELPRVMEIMARHMAGLILEGIDARIFAYTSDDDEDDG